MTLEFDTLPAIAIIPARYQSSRFPGKPLVKIGDKPMIQWVYEAAAATSVAKTIVATDDRRIYDCVIQFGGQAAMTSADHQTGTDRIAEVAAALDVDIVLNIQGDEPLLSPALIDRLIQRMTANPRLDMGTIAVPIRPNSLDYHDPHVVKVVVDANHHALYFSRSALPYYRDGDFDIGPALKHWGIYAFRKPFLGRFVTWPQGTLERIEKLEQLRALENGTTIGVVIGDSESIAVDVPEDVAKIEERLRKQKG